MSILIQQIFNYSIHVKEPTSLISKLLFTHLDHKKDKTITKLTRQLDSEPFENSFKTQS